MGDRTCRDSYGCIVVTGEGSLLSMKTETGTRSLDIRGNRAGLYVTDGGLVTNCANVYVGHEPTKPNCADTAASDDTFIELNNGRVYAVTDVNFGWTADVKCYPRLQIRGGDSFIRAGNDFIFRGNLGGRMIFDFSDGIFTNEVGELRAPVNAKTMKPYSAGDYAYGQTAIVIRGFDALREHGGEDLPLIEQSADNTNMERMLDWLSLADFPEEYFEGVPYLFLTDDKKILMLHVPEVRDDTPIDFTASVAPSVVTSNMTFTITLASYGGVAKSATVAALIGEEADFSDAVEHVLLDDVADAPTWTKTADVGTFPQHKPYFARVILTNNKGDAATNDLAFTSGGYPESFKWTSVQNGSWQDVTKWTCTDQSFIDEPTCPHAEDTIAGQNAFPNGTYTVSFADDAAVKGLGSIYGKPTFDLGGHRFDIVGGSVMFDSWYGYKKHDDTQPLATVTFKNGTLSSSVGFSLGAPGNAKHHAGLVLDNCAFAGSISFWCNESRVWVQNGSVWTLTGDLTMNKHTVGEPWAQLKVKGAGSKIVSTDKSVIVRGNCAGMFIEDGGVVDVNTFSIGYSADGVTVGDLASTNTLVSVNNGTIKAAAVNLGWMADTQICPQLVLRGASSAVRVAGKLTIYEKHGTRLCFEVPETGYADVPVKAQNIDFKTRSGTDYGPLRVEITAKRWLRANRGRSQPLVTLMEANPTALTTLANALQLTDVSPSRYPGAELLTVSDDGKTLSLNSPNQGIVLIVR